MPVWGVHQVGATQRVKLGMVAGPRTKHRPTGRISKLPGAFGTWWLSTAFGGIPGTTSPNVGNSEMRPAQIAQVFLS